MWRFNDLLLFLKRYRGKRAALLVNVGSGFTVPPGWLNIDANPKCLTMPKDFIHHDVRYGLPLVSDSAMFVYSSHFLEHLYLDEARTLLHEIHRVLSSGGIVRICVPDLKKCIDYYTSGERQRAVGMVFPAAHPDRFSEHHYMYDAESLRAELENAGFTSVRELAFQEGAVPDLVQLDNRREQTIYVEATKS